MEDFKGSLTDPVAIAEELISIFRMFYDSTERGVSVAGEKINYLKRVNELEKRLSGEVNLKWYQK